MDLATEHEPANVEDLEPKVCAFLPCNTLFDEGLRYQVFSVHVWLESDILSFVSRQSRPAPRCCGTKTAAARKALFQNTHIRKRKMRNNLSCLHVSPHSQYIHVAEVEQRKG